MLTPLSFDQQKSGERVSEEDLHAILSDVDANRNAQVDLGEFLQVGSCHGNGCYGDE